MKEFFRSKTFKVMLVLLVLLFVFFLRAVYTGGLMPFVSGLGGAIATPISEFFTGIGNSIHDFLEPMLNARSLQSENEELRQQLDALTERQLDYDELKNQNELYHEFFEISDSNTDYSLEPATVIARTADDRYCSFVINVGSTQGITAGMPVITDNGLVGVVSQVSGSYSKVSSLLDPTVSIGILDSATRDTGILSGDAALADSGISRMNYISKNSTIASGDVLITSGYGGMIPQGLIVGYVSVLEPDPAGLTLRADIRLAAQPQNARRVFVITDYIEKLPVAEDSPATKPETPTGE